MAIFRILPGIRACSLSIYTEDRDAYTNRDQGAFAMNSVLQYWPGDIVSEVPFLGVLFWPIGPFLFGNPAITIGSR